MWLPPPVKTTIGNLTTAWQVYGARGGGGHIPFSWNSHWLIPNALVCIFGTYASWHRTQWKRGVLTVCKVSVNGMRCLIYLSGIRPSPEYGLYMCKWGIHYRCWCMHAWSRAWRALLPCRNASPLFNPHKTTIQGILDVLSASWLWFRVFCVLTWLLIYCRGRQHPGNLEFGSTAQL